MAKTPKTPKRPPISLDEAARRLGLDAVAKRPANVVRGMVRRGEIVGIPAGRFWMVDADSIDELIGGAAIEIVETPTDPE